MKNLWYRLRKLLNGLWNWLKRSANNIIFLFFVLVFMVLAAWILNQAIGLVGEAVTAVSDIAVALLAGAFAILAAIVKQSGDQQREREHREWREKQENYKELLSILGDYLKETPGSLGKLSSAHLGSFAFGDLNVISTTNALMTTRNDDNLFKLMGAMRKSLQGKGIDQSFWDNYDTTKVFGKEPDTQTQLERSRAKAQRQP